VRFAGPERRLGLPWWVALSVVAHLNALIFALCLWRGGVAAPVPEIHLVDLLPAPATGETGELEAVIPPLPTRLPRLGTPSGTSLAGAADSVRIGTGARGEGDPPRRPDPVVGADHDLLRRDLYNHPDRNTAARARARRAARAGAGAGRGLDPTPFLDRGRGPGRWSRGSAPVALEPRSARVPPGAALPPGDGEARRGAPAAVEGEPLSRIAKDGDEGPLPLVTHGHPRVGGGEGSERRGQQEQASARRLPDVSDMARASGRGRDSGAGAGSVASRRGVPWGDPQGAALWLTSRDRRYTDYFRGIYRKVNPLWVFPKKLEVLLEQGDVLIEFTILADGDVRDVRVRKSSGFSQFDDNVVAAIRKAAPFGRIPDGLGSRLRIVAPFEFANPMVR